jgi:hypothetical protein
MGTCFTTPKHSLMSTYTSTYMYNPLEQQQSPTYSKYNVDIQNNSPKYSEGPLNCNIPPIYFPPPT